MLIDNIGLKENAAAMQALASALRSKSRNERSPKRDFRKRPPHREECGRCRDGTCEFRAEARPFPAAHFSDDLHVGAPDVADHIYSGKTCKADLACVPFRHALGSAPRS